MASFVPANFNYISSFKSNVLDGKVERKFFTNEGGSERSDGLTYEGNDEQI